MQYIKHFDKNEAKLILDKLVPLVSPGCQIVQQLVIEIIGFAQDYAMTINGQYNLTSDALALIDCQDITEQVIKAGKTDTWAVTYMLVIFYQVYGKPCSSSNAWRLMSGYLQVMFIITSYNDEHFSRINQLGVRVRMGLKANNPQAEILESLMNIHGYDCSVQQTLMYLRKYEADIKKGEESGKIANKKLASKIGQIRIAYEVVVENKAFVSKKRSNRDNQELSNEHASTIYLDSDNEPLRVITFSTEHQDNNVAYDENFADDDSIPLLDNDFKPTRNVAKSSELQQWKLKNNHQHARRNHFRFPTNTRQLSVIGYQQVFARLWEQFLIVSYKERHAYAVILLCLISGRKIQEIIEELELEKGQRKWLRYGVDADSNKYAINNKIDVTLNRRSHLLEHLQSHGSEFILPIPIKLQVVIENKLSVNADNISELLLCTKDYIGLPALTSQHIEAGLFVIIKNELNESLHADMITGINVKHSSSLYYTSVETKSVRETYEKAVYLLTDCCEKEVQILLRDEYYTWFESYQHKQFFGSDMTLKNSICKQFFEQLATSAESYNGRLKRNPSKRYDRYIEQLNAYSIWLWHIVMIQTGIRPVRHAPGLLNQIDFEHRILWVSDKEERNGQAEGRLIPLSSFLIKALEDYIAYIKKFAAIHNVIYPKELFPLADILDSKQPLIQIYSKNPKGFSGITPSKVRYQLKDFFSHQDNWLRHQLRSMLTNKSPEHLICALYGHEHPDQEAMHPMSSLSINGLKGVTVYLDQIAGELELKQIEVSIYG